KYRSMGSPENFSSFSLTGGHMETQEMRNIWKQFIREHL
ncbi:MAG: hydrolase, partial [Enterococcus faecium]|nr:hydrolase [Enterococcus faecium]